MNITPGSVWEHNKRKEKFVVIAIARLEWSNKPEGVGRALVIYRAISNHNIVFARPVDEWFDPVNNMTDGEVPRFKCIADKEADLYSGPCDLDR